ncbi:hypothetical protein [Gordonia bronchialis]|uniref:hypothetical protein n=1 Tax=Gordonia bronchialis TaxID=2054 RepID=UPI00227104B0|nr:hypothetical protein [Gordonia bronchialis]
MLRRILQGAIIAVSAVGLIVMSSAARADAAPARTVITPVIWTVAYGPACGGNVSGLASTVPNRPGTLYLQATGRFLGISDDGGQCRFSVRIFWRKVNTAGVVRGEVRGMLIPSSITKIVGETVRTGPGRVEFWIVTDRPSTTVPRSVIDVA